MKKNTYVQFENTFFERIINQKRMEMFKLVCKKINISKIKDLLDIGTTNDSKLSSSNFFCRMFDKIPKHKSISNQKINNSRFERCLKKSITSNFSKKAINILKSDLVISSAVIEHVGNFKNQTNKVRNMIQLSKKYVIITTPNRFFPVEVHTKLPLIHWLPKKMFRKILLSLRMDYFACEKNLNLLDIIELKKILDTFSREISYKIYNIRFLYFVSNFLVICKVKKF
jgi:hypothetical protein